MCIFDYELKVNFFHSLLPQVHIQLYKKFATIYRPFLVKLDQDFCELFSAENTASPIAKIFNLENRRKFGNLYDPCPISVTENLRFLMI